MYYLYYGYMQNIKFDMLVLLIIWRNWLPSSWSGSSEDKKLLLEFVEKQQYFKFEYFHIGGSQGHEGDNPN